MILKNSIYKLTFAAMISTMAMNAGEASAQGEASKTEVEIIKERKEAAAFPRSAPDSHAPPRQSFP